MCTSTVVLDNHKAKISFAKIDIIYKIEQSVNGKFWPAVR